MMALCRVGEHSCIPVAQPSEKYYVSSVGRVWIKYLSVPRIERDSFDYSYSFHGSNKTCQCRPDVKFRKWKHKNGERRWCLVISERADLFVKMRLASFTSSQYLGSCKDKSVWFRQVKSQVMPLKNRGDSSSQGTIIRQTQARICWFIWVPPLTGVLR